MDHTLSIGASMNDAGISGLPVPGFRHPLLNVVVLKASSYAPFLINRTLIVLINNEISSHIDQLRI